LGIKYPFQNPELDLETRINDLVGRLTVEEKMALIPTRQAGIDRLGIAPFHIGGEAAHGLVYRDGSPTTVFPQTIGLAFTWNPGLLRELGTAAADEARAYYYIKGRTGGLILFAPTVDLERDPRWGRTEEGYGEDPHLTSTLAGAYVEGMQGNHPFYLKTAATLKHFFANNNEENRGWCSASVDWRNTREYYWQAYQPIVEKAKACSIMTAYNAVNGVPAILLKEAIDEVKHRWGLAGFVVSDEGDFRQIVELHGYFDSHAQSIAATLKSGVDCLIDDPELVVASLREAFAQGLIAEADLDRAVKNILRARFRLGHFDPVECDPFAGIGPEVICSGKHRRLALQAQRESIVLLKNEDRFLPLDRGQIEKIAVIGPLADTVDMDWYTGYAPYKVTILDGIRSRLPDHEITYCSGHDQVALKAKTAGRYLAPDAGGVLRASEDQISKQAVFELNDWGWGRYTLQSQANGKFVTTTKVLTADADQVYGWFVRELYGLEPVDEREPHIVELKTWDDRKVRLSEGCLAPASTSKADEGETAGELLEVTVVKDGLAEAVQLAKEADVVILCAGNHPLINGKEEIDRPDITLPPRQHQLIKAVYEANPRTVLVLVASYPVAVNYEQEHLPAIVYTANCCQELGNGVADVLFGDYNPAGRLSMTWYRSKNQLTGIMDYDIIKGKRTYMYFNGQPLYPFGFGLSYTDFAYSDLKLSSKSCNLNSEIRLKFTVTNTGPVAGDEVAQVYVRAESSRVKRPQKQLKGFRRIHLQPGESKELDFAIPVSELSFYDVTREKYCVETGFYTILAGRSSAQIELVGTVWVNGEEIPPRDLSQTTRAEAYDDYEGVYLDECREGGSAVVVELDDGWLCYRNVRMPESTASLELRAASPKVGGSVELRCDHPFGELLGRSVIEPTGGSQVWRTFSTAAAAAGGIRDLYLVMKGDIRLAWLHLKRNS